LGKNINKQARRKRLKRIISSSENTNFSFTWFEQLKFTKSYIFVLIFVTFLMPFYPRFASIAYNNNQYDFIRNDIDESSIIGSFYADYDELYDDAPILESADSFLSINNILDDERDLAWTNEIVEYEIQYWDSISSIAYDFKVSNNSIYWANDFSKSHIIHPWDIIKVPPISWLIHQIKSWDSISTIAKKYDVDSLKISEQNLLSLDEELSIWDVLVIPWAIKKVVKPVYKPVANKYKAPSKTATDYGFSKYASSSYVNDQGSYKLVRRKPQHTFYWWNCTRYVWQYKDVNWWWNANQWIKNAQAKWRPTWNTPTLWSIIVFDWRGYNPRYW